MKKLRSPFFYTGDKYKTIDEIKRFFPEKIEKFIEPFVGGGSVLLNVSADEFFENDIDFYIISLHQYFYSFKNADELLAILFKKIDEYSFSCSFLGKTVPADLKKRYVKTYFAKYNAENYKNLKEKYNVSDKSDFADLYLLLIYGFNRMLRFNAEGKFNLPVGNVDFNKNAHVAICDYIQNVNCKKIRWHNQNFVEFFQNLDIGEGDFVYADPPYLITASEYNKNWKKSDDEKLFEILDALDKKNIRFALSNVADYKGKKNEGLLEWAKKYRIHTIKSNYINYHDNSVKSFWEVLITNYEN